MGHDTHRWQSIHKHCSLTFLPQYNDKQTLLVLALSDWITIPFNTPTDLSSVELATIQNALYIIAETGTVCLNYCKQAKYPSVQKYTIPATNNIGILLYKEMILGYGRTTRYNFCFIQNCLVNSDVHSNIRLIYYND